MPRPGRRFFERYTPTVAKGLLGFRLVRVEGGRRLSGVIVETEAYRGRHDPASHAFRGMTPRNEVMFGPAGHAYVYFTMGVHHCLNITAEGEGTAGAVLIRAIQPVEGLDRMTANRGVREPLRLASGPGNLTRALGIDLSLNGEDMVASNRLFVETGSMGGRVATSSRVGISAGTAFGWRFYAEGNPYVSKAKPPKHPGKP